MSETTRIAFVGSGAMGEAMIRGLLAHGVVTPQQIIAGDPVAARRATIAAEFGVHVTEDNREAVAQADVVVLSVKPQVLPRVMAGLHGAIPSQAMVVSIVAGVPLATLCAGLGHERVVRTMPNTPAQVGKGVTVWCATAAVSAEQKRLTETILAALGVQIAVEDEHYLDAATGLSGSGPGYVLLLIEALIDAGVHVGFSRVDAQKMVLQTLDGCVTMMRESGLHPAELKNRVTSPAGTTAAGLYELEQSGIRAAMIRAVEAATRRSQVLGEVYSQKGNE